MSNEKDGSKPPQEDPRSAGLSRIWTLLGQTCREATPRWAKPTIAFVEEEARAVRKGWTLFLVISVVLIVLTWWGTGEYANRNLATQLKQYDSELSRNRETIESQRHEVEKLSAELLRLEAAKERTEVKLQMVRMEAIHSIKAAEFLNRFPLGYAIFTLTGLKKVVPFGRTTLGQIRIDWSNSDGQAYFNLTDTNVTITPPAIAVGNRYVYRKNSFTIARQPGAGIAIHESERDMIVLELVESREDGVVLVLGAFPKGH